MENKANAQKPTPPDFGALATQYKMSAGSTGLISQIDLADLDLGKSFNRQQGMAGFSVHVRGDDSLQAGRLRL